MNTVKELKNRKIKYLGVYYKYTCDFCREDFVFNTNDICNDKKDNNVIVFKCPNCGHIHKMNFDNIKDKTCNYWGNNNVTFELTKEETDRVNEFKHCHEQCADNTLGGKYTYFVTPTDVGNIIKIKCNVCGLVKNITDSDEL